MSSPAPTDPAERKLMMRLFYRGWRPTLAGRWVNRLMALWSALGLPPKIQAVLEVRGRASGRTRANPVAIASVEGKEYLVSMLGPRSEWVKNVEAAHGDAVLRQGRRRAVRLVPVPARGPGARAPRVRADREERRPALPAPRHRAAVRVRGDRRALSGVPYRSRMT